METVPDVRLQTNPDVDRFRYVNNSQAGALSTDHRQSIWHGMTIVFQAVFSFG